MANYGEHMNELEIKQKRRDTAKELEKLYNEFETLLPHQHARRNELPKLIAKAKSDIEWCISQVEIVKNMTRAKGRIKYNAVPSNKTPGKPYGYRSKKPEPMFQAGE